MPTTFRLNVNGRCQRRWCARAWNLLCALALKERVRSDRQRVTSRDWIGYPILTFAELPEIDISLVERGHEEAVLPCVRREIS